MAHNKLYRNFIILQGDEKKISDDKACSGYAKIEAKGDKCKISFYAQNLSQEKNYSIVLICYKKDFKQVVDLGSLKIKEGGKGEVTKEYYVNNIAGLGIDYSKISGAAVTVDDAEDSEYILYGFMSGEHVKDDWKKCKKVKYKDIDNNWKEDIVIEEKKKSNSDDNKHKKDHKDNEAQKDKDDNCEKKLDHKEIKENIKENKKEASKEKVKEQKNDNKDKEKCHKEECDKKDKDECCSNKEECDKKDKDECCANKEKCNKKDKDKCCDNKDVCECKHKYLNDDHDYKDKCDRRDRNNIDFDGYENDIEDNKEVDCFDFELRGDIGEYFSQVAKGFEEIKHKFKDIKYCKWYKVKINNIEDMCKVDDYSKYTVIYYPMMNYFPYIKRYGYFLLGYKCDKRGNPQYIVYGIPGKKDIEEQPYMGKTGFVTWMPEKNSDRGYWLMFYDYKKSSVVVPMKQ